MVSFVVVEHEWLRYHAHNKPHLFYSCAIAALSPVFVFVVTPLRKSFLYQDAAPLPINGYPLPNRPRDKSLVGYDDE
ncbi:unnamed protein product [[Candida] boidinii]|nr:unnamed protein product [[Candida] boidinii]GMF97825.1 unnamed protein product [[Candida] boidinii]